MRSSIKVLVVDDSALIRQMLTRALAVDPRIEIVGVAKTGVEAIEQARALSPDVITLDIEMPELTGLEALPHLQKHSDARVVMLSSLDDPDTTYQALSSGAVDFVVKPREGMATSITDLSELLLKKIRVAYRVSPERVQKSGPIDEVLVDEHDEEPSSDTAPPAPVGMEGPIGGMQGLERIVAIAASTGGPPALERVFQGLSTSLPAAYMIVQHLPPGFSGSLAKRLSSVSDVQVVEAVEGMRVSAGKGYIAPHGSHMRLVQMQEGEVLLHLDDSAPMHGVRPAADPLFRSVARIAGDRAIGVVLTGMGADGANGLLEIKQSGGVTIAQDEETSVVWGMPGTAMKLGAVRRPVPIGRVAVEVRRSMREEQAS